MGKHICQIYLWFGFIFEAICLPHAGKVTGLNVGSPITQFDVKTAKNNEKINSTSQLHMIVKKTQQKCYLGFGFKLSLYFCTMFLKLT